MRFNQCLVTGTGQGGTNLVAEYARATSAFDFTSMVEDRSLFSTPDKALPDRYATKLAVENPGYTSGNLESLLNANPGMCVIVSTRHPYDNCLSKIVRARHVSEGGDCDTRVPGPDAEVAVSRYVAFVRMYEFLLENFHDRVLVVPMEELIMNELESCRGLCHFLGLANDKADAIMGSYTSNRNNKQRKRYSSLDKSQVDMYIKGDDIYEGYYKNRRELFSYIIMRMRPFLSTMGYEDRRSK